MLSPQWQQTLKWVPTAEMPADGLTKALSRQKHEEFIRMIGLVNISDKLAMEQRAAKKKEKTTNQEDQLVLADAKVNIGRLLRG